MTTREKQVAFDPIAPAYDLLVDESRRWLTERARLEQWLESAGAGQKRVLDLGCGPGFHARKLALELGAKVVATDPAQTMLDEAQTKAGGDRVTWLLGSADEPPPGPFDLILLLGNTLSLIDDAEPVLANLAPVAVEGTLFVIQTLDYEALRKTGVRRTIRSDARWHVTKTLTPTPVVSHKGARLELELRTVEGDTVASMVSELIDHPTKRLVELAERHGWRLDDSLGGYGDDQRGREGSDRILVFERRGDTRPR